jgi:hypothetical protein
VETEYSKYFVEPIGSREAVYYDDYKKTPKTILQMISRSIYSIKVEKALQKIIEETQPELVYILHFVNKLSPSVIRGAKKMGLPVKKFIAANNLNKVVYKYLNTGIFEPGSSIATIANAMDVGDPSNFARILDLYQQNYNSIVEDITGTTYSDNQIRETISDVYKSLVYLLDPHGAVGYRALKEKLLPGQEGIFLETAHPAKFTDTMETIIGKGNIPLPGKLQEFMKGEKKSIPLSSAYGAFRSYLFNLK